MPTDRESDERVLVARAMAAPPAEMWAEYDCLRAKMEADAISPIEHTEMMRLIYRLEAIHVDRLWAVLELSRLYGRPFEEVMIQYGVVPRQRPEDDVDQPVYVEGPAGRGL